MADPMTMPQVKAFEEAKQSTQERIDEFKEGSSIKKYIVSESMLPAVCACVQEWHIENFPETVTPDNFPMSPIAESHNLIRLIFGEINKIYLGEITIPNE